MNAGEAANVLTLLLAAFPRGPWPQETEEMWLRDLVACEYGEAAAAVRYLRDTSDHTPTWHGFLSALNTVRADMRREREKQAALNAPVIDEAERRETMRRVASMFSKAKRDVIEHDHKPKRVAVIDPETGEQEIGEDGPVWRWTAPAERCPLCSLHDHTDRRLAGFDNGVPVRMYEITCPQCGWPGITLSSWTPDGSREAKRLREAQTQNMEVAR